MNETWEPIWRYPNYEVSDLGHVRNVGTERILQQADGKSGMTVSLRRDNTTHTARVCVLVAQHFLPDPLFVDSVPFHLNRDYKDNRAENLRWIARLDSYWYSHMEKKAPELLNRPVFVYETGDRYNDIMECADVMGCHMRSVDRATRSYRNTYLGYHFYYG